jgi:hypothetical protein
MSTKKPKDVPTAASGKLSDHLRLFAELKERKKQLEDLVKENNALIKQTEQDLVTEFLDVAEAAGFDDPTAFKVTCDGRNYGVTTKHYYSIKAENRDAAYAALRELGMSDLIVEKVDNRTLTKSLEDAIADAGTDDLPERFSDLADLLTQYDKSTISDRKAGTK